MGGSLRTFDEETRAFIKKRMLAITEATADLFRAKAQIRFGSNCPTLVNDSALSACAEAYGKELLGSDRVFSAAPCLPNLTEPDPKPPARRILLMSARRCHLSCWLWLPAIRSRDTALPSTIPKLPLTIVFFPPAVQSMPTRPCAGRRITGNLPDTTEANSISLVTRPSRFPSGQPQIVDSRHFLPICCKRRPLGKKSQKNC